MILIAASSKDVASLNIRRQILDHYSFEKAAETFQENTVYTAEFDEKDIKLITLEEELICAQNIPDFFTSLELVVFISRHSSMSGTPTLSVHTSGNLGEAELGGISRNVSVAPANAMREALIAMKQLKDEMRLSFEVSYECTHHGPSLNAPVMFTELGSSPEQWRDLKAAEAVAHATIKAISEFGRIRNVAALGIGGPHYNSKFTRIALESDIAFGHMIPKYAIPYVDAEILRQCVEKTLEPVDTVFLDWKGIKGEHKSKLKEILSEVGTPFKKV